ncbi:CdaR family protein [Robiginitalea sp. SC105]|uniref:CdaR family protein n=1 Tax=Robiginitalea sp. SC105 TaxID=2762332 RepID=UPI00163A0832|nr:YbbR-like domain-containing protein [Robiginitalea sp. SC105]MBC2840762.1 YbbR-like domain-containing protein [Robiginitalea sp. SC105]
MIKKLKSGIASPRAKIFLLFLLCSFLAWLIIRLAQTYNHTLAFRMEYQQVPDSLVLLSPPPADLRVRVRASGFQLMRYQISPKKVAIDLGASQHKGRRYFIVPDVYRRQVANQLGDDISLLEVAEDTIFLDFQKLRSRTVPVRPALRIELASNYAIDGPILADPPSVHLLGPPGEIDTIRALETESLLLTGVKDSVSRVLRLPAADRLPNTRFSTEQVTVKARVYRFSESVVDVPVEVINLPGTEEVRTFPASVGVLCKGRIEALKDLSPSDFRIVADFETPDPETNRLQLRIEEQPPGIQSVLLLETSVEFIVRNE